MDTESDNSSTQESSGPALSAADANLTAPKIWLEAYNDAFRRGILPILAAVPIIGEIERVKTEHAGPRKSLAEHGEFVMPMRAQAYKAPYLTEEQIRSLDLNAHARFIENIARQSIDSQAREFRTMLVQSTQVAGTSLDTGGTEMTIEHLRELMRRTDWNFDSYGRVRPKTIGFSGTWSPEAQEKLRNLLQAADNDPEIRKIIADKRRTLEARRARRKLLG